MFIPVQRYASLYKRGVKGEVRVWSLESGRDGDVWAYRTRSGIDGGTVTESGWSVCEPKNVGRSNATTSETQCAAEIAATYQIKKDRGSFEDRADIDKVAFTKPMLAQEWTKRRDKVDVSAGVYAQPKLDGIRCIARADGLWTRTGKPIVAVPHIVDALAPLFAEDPDLILDGELYNHALKDDFNAITSAVRKTKPTPEDIETARVIEYHVYDLPSHPGSFIERYNALFELLEAPPFSDFIVAVDTRCCDSTGILDSHYAEWMEDGYEGQMIRLDAPYEFKRSNMLMKRKDFVSEEFPVLAVEEGNGNWSGCVKRFIVALPNDKTCEATPRGTQDQMRGLLVSGETPDWATVRHFGYTPDGKLRFPIVTDYGFGRRED